MLDTEILDWLQSANGEEAMRRAAELHSDPLAAVTMLRRTWTREQSAAALEQAELRRRARRKFADAGRMLFEAEALEQASGEAIAGWRARRFRPFDPVADLGCGIGGDTFALAAGAWTVGIDPDAERLALARANARALGLAERCAFVRARVPELAPRVAAAFADPDRRPGGARTRRLARMLPSLPDLLTLQERIPALGVKLSPALDETELATALGGLPYELEFLSEHGVCKEAVLWLGELATVRRRASVLPEGATLTDGDPAVTAVKPPGAYLIEPDAAIIRAHLVEQAAAALGAWKIDPQVALLSADCPSPSPLARCYAIRAVTRANVAEIGRLLRSHGYGSLVIKRRASAVEPEAVRKRLLTALVPDSPREAVLLFTRLGNRPAAFLCEAVHGSAEC